MYEFAALLAIAAACSTEVVEVLPPTVDRDAGEHDAGETVEVDAGVSTYRCTDRFESVGSFDLSGVLLDTPLDVTFGRGFGLLTHGDTFIDERGFHGGLFTVDASLRSFGTYTIFPTFRAGSFVAADDERFVVVNQIVDNLVPRLQFDIFTIGQSSDRQFGRWSGRKTITDLELSDGKLIVTSTSVDVATIDNITTRGLVVGFGAREIDGRYDSVRIDRFDDNVWVFLQPAGSVVIEARALNERGADRVRHDFELCPSLRSWDAIATGADDVAIVADCTSATHLYLDPTSEPILISDLERRVDTRLSFDGRAIAVAFWPQALRSPIVRYVSQQRRTLGGFVVDLPPTAGIPARIAIDHVRTEEGANRWALAATHDIDDGDVIVTLFDACEETP